MTTYLGTLTTEDKNLLNHFLNFTREIRTKSQNNSTVNLIPFGEETSIGAMTVGINAGTMFIANCGNITMFYNFELSASVNTHLSPDIITANAANLTQYNATAQAQTLAIGLSLAAADTPNKTGTEAQGNANDSAAPSAGVQGAPRRGITTTP
jgi:hypothetical protein